MSAGRRRSARGWPRRCAAGRWRPRDGARVDPLNYAVKAECQEGFASVVYSLIILQSDIADASLLFQAVALAATVSMVLHSSTDVVIANWFRDRYADI